MNLIIKPYSDECLCTSTNLLKHLRRDVPIAVMDLSKIDKSFLWSAITDYSGIDYYLNIETGEIVDNLEGDLDDEVLESDNYVYIEPISSRESYTFMEDFIMIVRDLKLKRG